SSCFLASGECVFDLTAVDRALQLCGEPVEMRDNGRLMIWFPAQVGKQYLIGVDPASGSSEGDYSCAEVVERRSGIQCAELHGHFPPRELATKLIELANYYCRALLVVERNNHGHGDGASDRCQAGTGGHKRIRWRARYCELAPEGVSSGDVHPSHPRIEPPDKMARSGLLICISAIGCDRSRCPAREAEAGRREG